MTIKNIIDRLEVSGENTKKEVINSLINASEEELLELKQSIEEEIRKKRAE